MNINLVITHAHGINHAVYLETEKTDILNQGEKRKCMSSNNIPNQPLLSKEPLLSNYWSKKSGAANIF